MGEPSQKPRGIRIIHIWKKHFSGDPNCILSNGINIITPKTIKTGESLLSQPNIRSWIIITDSIDPFADELWNKVAQK